jgi:hypothetical protein
MAPPTRGYAPSRNPWRGNLGRKAFMSCTSSWGLAGKRAIGSAAKAIALACWQLHLQHSSTWTCEIDLLPAGSASFQCESLALNSAEQLVIDMASEIKGFA